MDSKETKIEGLAAIVDRHGLRHYEHGPAGAQHRGYHFSIELMESLLADPELLALIPAVKALQDEVERLTESDVQQIMTMPQDRIDALLRLQGHDPKDTEQLGRYAGELALAKARIIDLESQLAALQGGAKVAGYLMKGSNVFYPASHKPTDIHNFIPLYTHTLSDDQQAKDAARYKDALEEIALAGMSMPMAANASEEATRAFHARQAWKFIGIAANAISTTKQEESK